MCGSLALQVKRMCTDVPFILYALQSSSSIEVKVRFICFT